jgi:hypothetical protein
MAKPVPKAPADCVAAYERAVATLGEVERKGAANPYTSVNGNMVSVLRADGVLGLRLSPADRAAFLAEHAATLFESYGAVMPEYVAVPPALLADTAALTPWMARSWDYAKALKPKPTTRKK